MFRPTLPGRPGALAVAAMAGVSLALLASCGGGSDGDTAATTTTAAPADATTTTAADTTSTTGSGTASTAWSATATPHRGENGTTVAYSCPARVVFWSVSGTEIYTDDSSVCTAAVHVGLITTKKGGEVTIEIQAGEDLYDAGEANGVISQYYGPYEGSFTFPDAPPGSGEFAAPAISWSQTAASLEVGASRTLVCSAGGTAGSVWGTGTFTADSSICTAAVLEGLITQAAGGTVTVDVVAGADSYSGSKANGITSQDYPAYSLSFEFAADQPSG